MIVAKGKFEGRGGHTLHGNFTVERRSGDHWLVTSDDFFFNGSPEPAFAFASNLSPNAAQAQATRFLSLSGTGSLIGVQSEVSGTQEGKIGPDFDPVEAKTIFLWCFLTPFLLGIGPIIRAEAGL